jgi:hypothetical protein
MTIPSSLRSIGRWLAGAAALAAGAYGTYAGVTWIRYGRHTEPGADERDSLLDAFMPQYEVVDRHHIQIAAPADVVMAAAREMDLFRTGLVKAIFKARQAILGGTEVGPRSARGILEETLSMGWGVLVDVPGREVVVGAVTKPWEADVKFIAVPPDKFAAFNEPDHVKIAWTLRADPVGRSESIFRTETRVQTTDAASRAKFRPYWSFVSPGVWLIRRMSLTPLKLEAERRFRESSLAA